MRHPNVFSVILSLKFKPPLIQNLSTMPKAKLKSTNSNDEEPHGYINRAEAKAHVEALESLMTKIKKKVEK